MRRRKPNNKTKGVTKSREEPLGFQKPPVKKGEVQHSRKRARAALAVSRHKQCTA